MRSSQSSTIELERPGRPGCSASRGAALAYERVDAITITARTPQTTMMPARPTKIAAIANRGIESGSEPSTISFWWSRLRLSAGIDQCRFQVLVDFFPRRNCRAQLVPRDDVLAHGSIVRPVRTSRNRSTRTYLSVSLVSWATASMSISCPVTWFSTSSADMLLPVSHSSWTSEPASRFANQSLP